MGNGVLPRCVSLLLFCLFAFCAVVRAQTNNADYVGSLIEAADRLALDRHPYWRLLLHCQRDLFGVESRVDDPSFFVDPDGKRDPRAELHTILRSLAERTDTDAQDHPAQKFPARVDWLREQLNIDMSRLHVPARTKCDELLDQMRPVSATLVFPACHLNNPASMFGHTLIVFDSQDRNRLLSQSVSYAGQTEGGFSPFFIIGSFIGSFPGYYGIMPYYDKVEMYRDIGYRDIWEYELDLTPEEVRRMVRHTWELQTMRSDYYFFTENCAFNLYFLMDAARPSLRLAGGYRPWVTPIDVVKKVCDRGLVRRSEFRPSKVSTLQFLCAQLKGPERDLAHAVALGDRTPDAIPAQITDPDRQVMALDLASQFAQYRYTSKIVTPEEYRRVFLPILRERSRIKKASETVCRVPDPVRPDKGHDGNRLALGAGHEGHDDFVAVRYRPAYHSIADSGAGFDPGFQMEFLDAEVRRDTGSDQWSLERIDVVDIVSIAPCDRFFKPKSWQVSAGLARRRTGEDTDQLVGQGLVGFGYSARCRAVGLAYVLFDARAETGNIYRDNYAIGAGPSAGIVADPFPWWKLVLQGNCAWFVDRDRDLVSRNLSLRQNITVTRNNSIGLELWHGTRDGYESNGGAAFWNVCF